MVNDHLIRPHQKTKKNKKNKMKNLFDVHFLKKFLCFNLNTVRSFLFNIFLLYSNRYEYEYASTLFKNAARSNAENCIFLQIALHLEQLKSITKPSPKILKTNKIFHTKSYKCNAIPFTK